MPLNTKNFKYIGLKNIEKLPNTTGIYAFFAHRSSQRQRRCKSGFLYIGKAINIKNRVKNHINQPTFKDNIFVPETKKIGFIATGSEIEALILEASLIKKYQPKYNTVWRDGKSHNYVSITKEEFPRVFISHQLLTINYKLLTSIGPFIDGKSLKQTLRVLRKVFPFRTCNKLPKKACLYKELGLCLAPCQFKVQSEKLKVKKNINNLTAVLRGQKKLVVKSLQKEMALSSHQQDFEKAKVLRDQIFALNNVFSHSHILGKEGGNLLP
ncbi:MAG: GIY-YIG nuclease family protein, partial [Patescibacteria group bacterium]